MKQTSQKFIYRHDCPALGKDAIIPRALVADPNGEYILAYQHKCPLCSKTAGERVLAKGVIDNPNGIGYLIDTSIAEKLH